MSSSDAGVQGESTEAQPAHRRPKVPDHRSPITGHPLLAWPRWAKVLRDLWSHKTRSLLVVLSIAVGVFAIGVIAGTRTLLDAQFTGTYLGTNPAHATLSAAGIDDDLIEAVARMPEVEDAGGRFGLSVTVAKPIPGERWQDLTLYARSSYADPRVNLLQPEAGAWPPPDGGIVFERNSLPLLNAQIGDTVQVDLGDGRIRALQVAGAVHDINLPPARFVDRLYGYVNWETLNDLGYARQFNELLITVAERPDDKRHIQAVSDLVQEKMEASGLLIGSVRVPDPGQSPVQDILDSLFLILGILGALALLLSGFLVVNTMAAILAQQVRQVGVMKAVGARTGQVVSLYLGMALLYGLAALVVAVPLGTLGAYRLASYAAGFLNFDVVNQGIPPAVLALQVAVSTLLPVAAAAAPIALGARVTVLEAISSYGLGKGRFGKGPVDHLLVHLNRRLPFITRPLLISLRNTFRRKARLALTMVTLTLGGAIFIAVFSVRQSLANTLDLANRYDNYDVAVEFDRHYRVDQIQQEAAQVPGVTAVETWGSASAVRKRPDNSQSERFRIRAPVPDSAMIQPNILAGRWLLPADESAVVINTNLQSEEEDLRVGDTLTVDVNGKEVDFTIVGLVHSVLDQPTAYVNYPYFSALTGAAGRTNFARVSIEPDDPASQRRVADALKTHFDGAGYQVYRTDTKAQDVQSIELRFAILVTFLLVMALLIALVGGMGLMGTMSINVLERTREIGVLRAIGASDGSLMQIILLEGVLIGLISWVQASLLGWPIGRLMSDQIGLVFVDSPLVYGYSVRGALLWLLAAALISAVASFIPAHNAARLTVREVLSYE